MRQTFQQQNYPLDIQCGRRFWDQAGLSAPFRLPQRPPRSYFFHLIADRLRLDHPTGLSAAELELWATLNQVLLEIGRHHLNSRRCRIDKEGLQLAGQTIPLPELPGLLLEFLRSFPALPVALGTVTDQQLLERCLAEGDLNELLLQLFLLRVQSQNPALQTAAPLFHEEEQELQRRTAYHLHLEAIDRLLPQVDDGFGVSGSLLMRLTEPLKQGGSLRNQLEALRLQWGALLPEELLGRLGSAYALLDQEGVHHDFPAEPPAIPLDPAATHQDEEVVNFTVDLEWMPRTVLLAKSTYVWLHQLSRKYHWHIHRLDHIPDQELDELAESGFTSLWLIGIWQRSKASRKIKELYGQVQVAASAYAIEDYRIADDLGGEAALENLRQRCRQRGIDLACDVVTNHTGIDSVWVREHPDWFIQLPTPPYPGYCFTGPDLSEDSQFSIRIEDGYYDHSEAAVVCRYQQRHSGEVRYIYHGNDGTHLPWNDTAQLDYLLPQVREAMIQLILQVARSFRVIRFDAAMTLAKRHFQRLWYPLPGGGAGVPSRSDHSLSQEEFNRCFPVEFWKELVDRVREQVPDTLLVAEAFWLMEGYFVRTLGMHRVYNSAFMNMLKQEENAKYRQTLKNILSFDPAILQRFVNFMSNPDEKPAIEQFGREEKYFCVATLLATMPGLPMFGHGQIEGFHEKYGMEYLAPRWQEQVDEELHQRHRREIFPLLRQRALFSGAEQFQLYDFISAYGVEENVFAYSNRFGDRHVLVLCNNSPNQIYGRIGDSCPRSDQGHRPLKEACQLNLNGDFVLLHDMVGGRQFLQSAEQMERGGQFLLPPYAHMAFRDFTEIYDHDGRWRELWERYAEQGHSDLYAAHENLLFEPFNKLCEELYQLQGTRKEKSELIEFSRRIYRELQSPGLQGLTPSRYFELQLQGCFPGEPAIPEKLRLELEQRLIFDLTLPPNQLYRVLDPLFGRKECRKLVNAHYYNEIDWFEKEGLDKLLIIFFKSLIFRSHQIPAPDYSKLVRQLSSLLMNLQTAQSLEEKSSYQVDIFLQSLQGKIREGKVIPAATGGDSVMKILFVTPEAIPFAKTGGLADVAGSLPRALRQLGHDVRVILPCHRVAERGGVSLRKGRKSVEIDMNGTSYRGSLKQAACDGVPYWFIDCPEFFDREPLYGTSEGDYPDNALRFGFFCRAVLEMIKRLDFRPDVIHINDWQTGLIPVLLRTELRHNPFYASIASLLTIHNLGYQGLFPISTLKQLGLHESLASPDRLEYFGQISMLKGAIQNADVINTVSPTYCDEIQRPELGHGFDGILRNRAEDLHGIINGLDHRIWDPALDTALPTAFNVENLNGKRACKRLLQKELGLEMRHEVPIVAVISRMDRQKGIDLIRQAWEELLKRDIQFILLGSGDQKATKFWQEQKGKNPEKVSISLTFDEDLSRRVYAASDLLLMPSLYEPCGLTQMIALHYGSLPIVRRTGGLADTVIDVSENSRQGCGFVFDDFDPRQMLAALDRALELYPQRNRWLTLVKRGMSKDFSWTSSAETYDELYSKARSYRQMPAA